MKFSTFCAIHNIFLGCIAFWAPSLVVNESVSLLTFLAPAAVLISVLWIARASAKNRNFRIDEVIAYCLTSTGLAYAALNHNIEAVSPETFPPLTAFYTISFVGMLAWISVGYLKNGRADRTGFGLALWSSGLFYTQPLDKFANSIILPLLFAIIGLTASYRSNREDLKIHIPKSLKFIICSIGSVLIILVLRDWTHQKSEFYPNVIILGTVFVLTALILRLSVSNKAQLLSDIRNVTSITVIVLFIHAFWRLIWLGMQYDIAMLPKFRMWIAQLHPNAIAAYLNCAIPLLLIDAMESKLRRWVSYGTVFLALMMLLGTISRGGWLSLLLGGIASVFWLRLISDIDLIVLWKRKSIKIAFLAILTLVFVLLAFVSYRVFAKESVLNRKALWSIALHSFTQHPLLGAGIGNHEIAAGSIKDPFDRQTIFLDEWLSWDRLGRHCHNTVLEILYATGITGFICCSAFIAILMVKLHRERLKIGYSDRLCAASFIMLLIHGIFDFAFFYPALAVALFLALATVISSLSRSTIVSNRLSNECARIKIWIAIGILVEVYILIFPALGDHWLQRGRMKAEKEPRWALAAFNKALYYKPYDVNIYWNLIPLNLQMKKPDAAMNLIRKMSQHHPDDARILAIQAWASPNPFDRLKLMTRALDSDYTGLMQGERNSDMGLMLAVLGDLEKSRRNLKLAYLLDPRLPSKLLKAFPRVFGGVLIRPEPMHRYLVDRFQGNFFPEFEFKEQVVPVESLLDEIETELMSANVDDRIHLMRKRLIQCRFYKGDLEAGARLLNAWNMELAEMIDKDEAVKTYDSKDPEYMLIQAKKMLKNRRYKDAENQLRKILDGGLDNAQVRSGLGMVNLSKENWAEAAAEFEKAIAIMPDLAEFYAKLGIARYHQGEVMKAKISFEQALKINPLSMTALYNLGTLYFEMENFEKAYQLLNKACEITPANAMIAYNRILAMSRAGFDRGEINRSIEDFARRFEDDELDSEKWRSLMRLKEP